MRSINIEDVQRACEWGLEASFLEQKMDSSVLFCLCSNVIEKQGLSIEHKALFDWATKTGAQIKLLGANSSIFFQLASVPGALWVWECLFNYGYTLDRVVAKVSGDRGASRVSTKLGLLCSAPFYLTQELPSLISLLIARGTDPNERDSDGYAPLGRLNEQLRMHEAGHISIEPYVGAIVKGVEVLLSNGAEIDGILPVPEAFAAKAISECIRSKREKADLLSQVIIPPESDLVRHHGKSL